MHFPQAAKLLLLPLGFFTCIYLLQILVDGSQLIVCNAVSVILVGNSLNCTLMFSFINKIVVVYNNGKIVIGKKLLRSSGFVLSLAIGLTP